MFSTALFEVYTPFYRQATIEIHNQIRLWSRWLLLSFAYLRYVEVNSKSNLLRIGFLTKQTNKKYSLQLKAFGRTQAK